MPHISPACSSTRFRRSTRSSRAWPERRSGVTASTRRRRGWRGRSPAGTVRSRAPRERRRSNTRCARASKRAHRRSTRCCCALRGGGEENEVAADLRAAVVWRRRFPAAVGTRRRGPVEHPLAPLRFGFLNGATLPGDGDEYTIHLQEPGFSQSFRAVWIAGDWDAGGIAIPSGESGEPGSGHYRDLSSDWIAGRLQSLPFSIRAIRAATRQQLVLVPSN